MRFVRRFLVVCAVVAAVVGLGYVWKGSGAAGLVAEQRDGRRPPDGATAGGSAPEGASGAPGDGERRDGRFEGRRRGSAGFDSIDDLGQTVVTEGVLIGGVVLVDRRRRRVRDERRIRRPDRREAGAPAP